jgi:molybdate transport system substrate-binding protein
VARGEVDTGFVYATDAHLMADKVKISLTVNTAIAIQYPIAKTASSSQVDTAQKFIAFVQSPAGQAILKKYGFGQ